MTSGNTSGTRKVEGAVCVTNLPHQVPEAFWLTRPRSVLVVGDAAYVPLTQRALAVIDAADAELVGRHNWYLHKAGKRRYAARSCVLDGVRFLIYLHQEIALPGDGLDVDHRDGDGLNNRRANLREATRQQNMANRSTHAGNASGYKGVWRHGRKFRASIQLNGKTVHLGGFDTAAEAALAYADAARQAHGEFANATSRTGALHPGLGETQP